MVMAFGLHYLSSPVLAGDDDPADERIANSPEEIRPLLIGMTVPTITGLTKTDGTPFDLNTAIAKKPTILIFYRGGW
jgi:hypothetical protein